MGAASDKPWYAWTSQEFEAARRAHVCSLCVVALEVAADQRLGAPELSAAVGVDAHLLYPIIAKDPRFVLEQHPRKDRDGVLRDARYYALATTPERAP